MLTQTDLTMLASRGISEKELDAQVNRFKTGFPYLKIFDSARPGNGITVLTPAQQQAAIDRWQQFLDSNGTVTKFVPASGAASRMFKSLFSFVDGPEAHPKAGSDVDALLKGIHEAAFFNELNQVVKNIYGADVDALLSEGREKDVVAAIIKTPGLNYGNMPKGLLTFHHAAEGTRTPVEEQLVEGAQSARQADGSVNLHLTVSPAHRQAFSDKLAAAIPAIENRMGVKINVEMSEQMPSTDTVAVNEDNTLFREDGQMVFRPGGHGALIRNLDKLTSDVVFIKNIDNVVPDKQREATLKYKKVIAGYLMELVDKIDDYVRSIDNRTYTDADLAEIVNFMREAFSFDSPAFHTLAGEDLATYLRTILNRPIRVCGMVKNEGEPGGGPYITFNADGSRSLQILESTQIDMTNPEYVAMMQKATHFNPVDLVCYIKDAYGHKFHLTEYVDPDTGFISSKSLHGRNLKALELPGLWNGAMAHWNTAFVEVPIATFNPVKTVNDLLRPVHKE